MKREFLLGVLAVVLAIGVCGGGDEALAQSWSLTTPMDTPKVGHRATLLQNGKVLVCGGSDYSGTIFSTTYLFDPADNTWTFVGNFASNFWRFGHAAVRLADGRVLVSGNDFEFDGGVKGKSAEVFDPATNTWATTGSMNIVRRYHDLILLQNGKVLAVGGAAEVNEDGVFRGYTRTCELYDPATGTWTSTGSMATGRGYHNLTLLDDGRVLVAGGVGNVLYPWWERTYLSSAEIYDPSTGTWSPAGTMSVGRAHHSVARLRNGKVLVAGGVYKVYSPNILGTAEIYDPLTNSWTPIDDLNEARGLHLGTILPDGKVLVAGGVNYSPAIKSTEVYDPEAGTWAFASDLNQGRWHDGGGETCTLLADCRGVLVTGGFIASGTATNTAEIFGPLYQEVNIDIKPGEEPNSINLGSKGNVPVAIFSTEAFDATQIDPASVALAGATVELKGKGGLFMTSKEDMNGDGLIDLLVHIDTTALTLSASDTEAVLTGNTFDGLCIRGTDTVHIVP